MDKAAVVREQKCERPGLEIDDVLSVRALGLTALNAELVRADGVEQRLGFAAARNRDAHATLKCAGNGD